MLGDMGLKERNDTSPAVQYVPPTIREQLTQRREALMREIGEIDNVVSLLDLSPSYEKIHDAIYKLRGLR